MEIRRRLDAFGGKMVRVQSGSETEAGNMSDGGACPPDEPSTTFPPTYMVLVCSRGISNKAFMWLVEKIRGKRRDGGAELLLRRQPHQPGEGVTLHVSASKIKFLEVAEELELKKRDREGLVREFTVSQLEEFLSEGMHVDDLLTTAERQHIVRHELENIRALAEDDHVPGHVGLGLYEGQSIVQACLHWGLLDQMYPLHDSETLDNFGRKWYWALFRKQPIEEIRLYFGEAIALYFSFLGFYTTALVVPMILGFLQLFMSTGTVAFFCMFNVLWVTVYLEVWKRKCSELAFSWGTIEMTSLDDDPRPNFHGQMAVDSVTGRFQPQFPRWKTNTRMYFVSLPIVVLCMTGAFCVMLASFWAEEYLQKMRREQGLRAGAIVVMMPSIVYTALVFVMNMYYRRLATYLTEWENHRTQPQFDRHRVTKLVLFEFVNNFMSLFYIAFYIQDMEMLKYQLAIMLIVLQAIQNFQEALLPLLIKYYGNMDDKDDKRLREEAGRLKRRVRAQVTKYLSYLTFEQLTSFDGDNGGGAKGKGKGEKEPLLLKLQDPQKRSTEQEEALGKLLEKVPALDPDDPRIEPALREGEMDTYEGTYDDYLEMFVQFGYVFMFSSVYPMAAFWAVVNNVLEIRCDAFKLCRVFQRPMAKRVKDTGAWQRAFEALGAISVMTNCGLLCISPELRYLKPDAGPVEWVLFFVFLEHVLLVTRHVLHKAIPERPEWVRVALAKINYQSKKALKNELPVAPMMHRASVAAALALPLLLAWSAVATAADTTPAPATPPPVPHPQAPPHTLSLPDTSGISGELTERLEVDKFFSLWLVFNNDGDVRMSDEPFTIFTPRNDNVTAAELEALLLNPPQVKNLLRDHIVLGIKLNLDLTGDFVLTTLGGRTVKARRVNGTLYANNARVLQTKVEVPNGVLVVLDNYLFPDDLRLNNSADVSTASPQSLVKINKPSGPGLDNSTFLENVNEILSFLKSGVRVFRDFLSRSNVSQLLQNGEEYTVLVPTDHAFQRWHPIDWGFYPFSVPEFTEMIMINHFIHGNLKQDSIIDGQKATTLGGKEITFSRKQSPASLTVEGAHIVNGDTPVGGGNIMFIGEVLFVNEGVVQRLHQENRDKETPPLLAFPWFGSQFLSHAFLALEENPQFTQITRFVNLADLAPHITGAEYTFFVPNDDAFRRLGLDSMPNNYLSSGEGFQVLLNHFVKGRLYKRDLNDGKILHTLGNKTIHVRRHEGNITVNDANIIESEVFVYNLGTMYFIDHVLFITKEDLPNPNDFSTEANVPSTTNMPAEVEKVPSELTEENGTLPDILLQDDNSEGQDMTTTVSNILESEGEVPFNFTSAFSNFTLPNISQNNETLTEPRR